MKKCPIFVYWAYFQKSLCSKSLIWGIFSLKIGHFFRSEGLALGNPDTMLHHFNFLSLCPVLSSCIFFWCADKAGLG